MTVVAAAEESFWPFAGCMCKQKPLFICGLINLCLDPRAGFQMLSVRACWVRTPNPGPWLFAAVL